MRAITTPNGTREVSALCLGAANFGTRTDPQIAVQILDRFIEAGGTFIDTANNYNQWHGRGGESETVLGNWLRTRPVRESVVLATKCGAQMTGTDPDADWEGLSETSVKAAVAGSLQRLGVDRIDLYYAHVDDRATPLAETVGAFGGLVHEGIVGAVGCSNTATWRLERARAIAARNSFAPYTVIQQEYTYLWPRPIPARVSAVTPELLDYATENPDLVITAYSPVLAGSYSRPERALPRHRGYAHASAYERLQVLREVAGELGATPNQVSLAWLMARPVQVIPVAGASSLGQLEEVLGALDLELDAGTLAQLDAL